MSQEAAFAIGVLPHIYAFHCYVEFHLPLTHSSRAVTYAIPELSSGFHICLTQPPAHPLRPVIPINARTLRITAAAGT